MPLKFRETGLALSPTEIRKDCTAFSGGWAVGYIYYEAREGHGDEPHTWFWSIHGVLGKPIDMRGHGTAGSLEDAKSYLEETWQRWLTWANRGQRVKGTKPPLTHGGELVDRAGAIDVGGTTSDEAAAAMAQFALKPRSQSRKMTV